eukprot:352979-Rhodomonas_salina.1
MVGAGSESPHFKLACRGRRHRHHHLRLSQWSAVALLLCDYYSSQSVTPELEPGPEFTDPGPDPG